MSQILVQPQSVKQEQKLSDIVRGFTFPQVQRTLTDRKGKYCIMGGLIRYFSGDPNEYDSVREWFFKSNEYIKKLMGPDHNTIWNICVDMNNSGSTFCEIADYLESVGL